MVFYATTCSARSTSKILWSLIRSAGFENVERFIPFPTFSLDLDRACASVSREAILSRQRLVKNFTFGTCIFTHVSHWLTWRARPLRDGQKGNKKHLSCNIAAEGVEKRCCAFYSPRSNLSCKKSGHCKLRKYWPLIRINTRESRS